MKFKKGDRVLILNDSSGILEGRIGVISVEMDQDGHYTVAVPSKKDWYFFTEDEIVPDTPLTRFLAGLDTKQDKK